MRNCRVSIPALFCIACCFFVNRAPLFAQSLHLDDSLHVFTLLDSAERYFAQSDYAKALLFSQKAADYAVQKKYKSGEAFALIEQADIYIDADTLDKAAIRAAKTATLGRQLNNPLIQAIATMQQAQIAMYSQHYEAAISLFENCTNYFSTHPSKYAALAFNDFGYAYGQIGQPEKQAACLIKSLEIYEKLPDPDNSEMAIVLSNLSSLYYSIGQMDKAIQYGEESIQYKKKAGDLAALSLSYSNLSQIYLGVDMAKAKQYQALGVQYAEESGDGNRLLSAYISSSLLASSQGDRKTAIQYEQKAIAMLEKKKSDSAMLSRRYTALGIYYMYDNDSLHAMENFQKALAIANEIHNKENLRDIYYNLTIFNKRQNNFAGAYTNFKNYINYRDSIVKENTQADIAEIQTKYETAKKDNKIMQLNADQRIKSLQIEKQNALLAGNKLEAARKEKEIELLSQARELQELRINQQAVQLEKQALQASNNTQKLQLAEKEKQLQEKQLKNSKMVRNVILVAIGLLLLFAYILFNRYQLKRKIKEQKALLDVREKIARDLHDEIGSTLTSIRILSEVSDKALQRDPEKVARFLQKITEQSAEAQQGISDIVWAVKPENDKIENMVIRMREYITHTLEPKNIFTTLQIDEKLLTQTLAMNQRRDLLMIFKEAINNIAKYAAAKNVQVVMDRADKQSHVLIADDGRGFDIREKTSSNGLKNMRARAEAMGAHLDIRSQKQLGTAIELWLPAA